MSVRILYFAWVREAIGVAEEVVEIPVEVSDITGLIDWLEGRDEAHRTAFADRSRLRAAVDQVFVTREASIVGAREIAIFPPVTGG